MDKVSFPDALPSVPTGLTKIQEFFKKESLEPHDLVEFLQQDSVLALHVLRLVNSPYYGLKKSVTSISQAVALLGVTTIRGIILAAVIKKSFPVDLHPYKISLEQLESVVTLRIKFLEKLAGQLPFDKDYLKSILFLMENGKFITSYIIQKEGLSDQFVEELVSCSIEEAEQNILQVTSYEAMELLLLKWGFDESFANSFTNIINPKSAQDKLLFVIVNTIKVNGFIESEHSEVMSPLIEESGVDSDFFYEVLNTITL